MKAMDKPVKSVLKLVNDEEMDEKEILCRRLSRQNCLNDQRAWSFIASQNKTPNRGVNVLKMGLPHRVEKCTCRWLVILQCQTRG